MANIRPKIEKFRSNAKKSFKEKKIRKRFEKKMVENVVVKWREKNGQQKKIGKDLRKKNRINKFAGN